MKKIILLITIIASVSACGTAQKQVQPADTSALKSLEIAQNSNSERVAELEKEVDMLRKEITAMRKNTKQVTDGYDILVQVVQAQRKMTIDLMNTVNKALVGKQEKK